jgi:hypothetical protein
MGPAAPRNPSIVYFLLDTFRSVLVESRKDRANRGTRGAGGGDTMAKKKKAAKKKKK